MSKKIKEVSESIKSKLSFEDYKVSTEVQNSALPELRPSVKTDAHKGEEKVKSTFYIYKSFFRKFEKLYYQLNIDDERATRSELMMIALEELFKKFKDKIKDD